ncbi:MAG: tRNA 4-thiouridine(8) synthase ThiI [Acidobacteria bacterium]|nr:tRNA 4-thiouridine(8) synthase ThiI [Acidobacteriota bacterium]
MTCLLVHYQELALKGRNRPWFVDRLARNLRAATTGLGVAEVRPFMSRVEIRLRPGADADAVAARVARVFGVANVAVADRLPADLDLIEQHFVDRLRDATPASFRVRVARSDKRFPVPSPDVERRLGGRLHATYGWPVDLDSPALVVRVEILSGLAYCSTSRLRGPGGLPTGASGAVLCLMSGGIDSPVAAYRVMRRGCRADLVHFHSYPLLSPASIDKARTLAGVLAGYQLGSRLTLVPFGPVQQRVVAGCPPALRVVIYRRFMFRIAERLARRRRIRALVTGDVVGQVASQTIENLAVVDRATELTVLRPLVGMDKEDITAEARAIGTYDTSILPDEDCCRLLTPKYPATQATLDEVERAEGELPVEQMVESAVDTSTSERGHSSFLGAG